MLGEGEEIMLLAKEQLYNYYIMWSLLLKSAAQTGAHIRMHVLTFQWLSGRSLGMKKLSNMWEKGP